MQLHSNTLATIHNTLATEWQHTKPAEHTCSCIATPWQQSPTPQKLHGNTLFTHTRHMQLHSNAQTTIQNTQETEWQHTTDLQYTHATA